MRVGFIGLGTMGEPMARSLQRAGFEVTASAHHRRDALERLVGEGAHEAADPAAVAGAVDAVVICVPDAPQVEEVLFGARGVAAGAKSGELVIDMSTISPVASRRFAERLAEIGVDFIDAPVSGGPSQGARRYSHHHGRRVGRGDRASRTVITRDGQPASRWTGWDG